MAVSAKDPFSIRLGLIIKGLREFYNLSQKALADILAVSYQLESLDQSRISKIEGGVCIRNPQILFCLARCFGTTVDAMLNYAAALLKREADEALPPAALLSLISNPASANYVREQFSKQKSDAPLQRQAQMA